MDERGRKSEEKIRGREIIIKNMFKLKMKMFILKVQWNYKPTGSNKVLLLLE